ncbi:MAG: winged helix-turn-helix domain-containing protein [Candidatus Cohnella colombiensis]|uniref:Winged helix-turn-helix domain-containing protein n=1 Tax=Candidatus Cohnella colombiensis TaxID=3121368 RepID=A0AA95EX08_9BACL|nr:MAG: winged helix-turn-helix domain-containing protein [Cohnella sp.]
MQQCYMIKSYDQLKAISDPFRVKILNMLIEGAYTGQQIAQQLEIPRAKIHYHLNELEKNELIEVVRNEVKNGIIQKFYRSIAYSFIPDADLLPFTTEVGDYYRSTMLEVLNRARLRVISAPDEAFEITNPDRNTWPRIALRAEVKLSEQVFVEWLGRFRSLVDELAQKESTEGKWFYLSTIGLQIDQPLFENVTDCDYEITNPEAEFNKPDNP